jgi:hypothetical protein
MLHDRISIQNSPSTMRDAFANRKDIARDLPSVLGRARYRRHLRVFVKPPLHKPRSKFPQWSPDLGSNLRPDAIRA